MANLQESIPSFVCLASNPFEVCPNAWFADFASRGLPDIGDLLVDYQHGSDSSADGVGGEGDFRNHRPDSGLESFVWRMELPFRSSPPPAIEHGTAHSG